MVVVAVGIESRPPGASGTYHYTTTAHIPKGNHYALTVICMLTNYVFMIAIRSKSTEEVIKPYLTDVYSTFRGSKYILTEDVSLLAISSHS